MNPIHSLRAAGLSEKEAATYLTLAQEGESKTGKICQKTRIPSSHIYAILNSLLEKGLINYKLINNIKVFRAADPDTLSQLIEEKEKSLHQEKTSLAGFIKTLKKEALQIERLRDFKYFQGIKGIRSIYTELMQNWRKNQELCIASSPLESFKTLESFFTNIMHKQRVKDKVKFRIIINQNSKKYGRKRAKLPLSSVRYLDLNTKTELGTIGEYFFMTTYDQEPYGLLIKDKNFSDTYKIFFDFIWRQAKP